MLPTALSFRMDHHRHGNHLTSLSRRFADFLKQTQLHCGDRHRAQLSGSHRSILNYVYVHVGFCRETTRALLFSLYSVAPNTLCLCDSFTKTPPARDLVPVLRHLQTELVIRLYIFFCEHYFLCQFRLLHAAYSPALCSGAVHGGSQWLLLLMRRSKYETVQFEHCFYVEAKKNAIGG